MSFFKKETLLFSLGLATIGILSFCSPDLAHASTSSVSMPYDTALDTIERSLTGKVAMVVTVLAVFGVFAWYVLADGEMKEVVKKLLMIAIGGGFTMGANAAVNKFFLGGAVIPTPPAIEQTIQNQKASKLSHLIPNTLPLNTVKIIKNGEKK